MPKFLLVHIMGLGAIVIVILGIVGFIVNYLLYSRAGPFLPGSSLSTSLRLDDGPLPTPSPLAASVAVDPAPATTATTTSPATPTTTTPTPVPINYLSITGADMPGGDMTVSVGDSTVTSQGTYGPTGCTAICSSNAGCKASVFQPSTKTCWIKSGVIEGNVAENSDRVLQIAAPGKAGKTMYSTSFTGNDIMAPVLPTFGDCSTLCQAFGDCAGVVYDNTYGKKCHLKSTMTAQAANTNTNAWVKSADH